MPPKHQLSWDEQYDRGDGGLTLEEKRTYEALKGLGFNKIIRKGWPDFAVLDGSEMFFVEVKNPKSADAVQPHQQATHDILRSKGFKVIVLYPGDHRKIVQKQLEVYLNLDEKEESLGVGC